MSIFRIFNLQYPKSGLIVHVLKDNSSTGNSSTKTEPSGQLTSWSMRPRTKKGPDFDSACVTTEADTWKGYENYGTSIPLAQWRGLFRESRVIVQETSKLPSARRQHIRAREYRPLSLHR
jgi:hypothetical protein